MVQDFVLRKDIEFNVLVKRIEYGKINHYISVDHSIVEFVPVLTL